MGKNTFVIEFAGITASRSIYIKKPEIQNGFWSDPKTGAGLKEATYGEKVKFTVGTKDIDDGTVLNFILYDYDGNYNPDDELSRSFSATVKNNIAELEFIPDSKWEESAKYEADNVVETYFQIETEIEEKKLTPKPKPPKKLIAKLPKKEEEYLKIYPKEVKITVLVELPHSLETGWGAKGLAGHTAMAIGDRYFDYGPDYNPSTIKSVNEAKYDYDFNDDGDKKDIVDLTGKVNHKFAPGKPWWGDFVADNLGISPKKVKLNQVIKFILQSYKLNNVYGEVHQIEFYVTEQQAKKMIDWWENRYSHPKAYSVFPWTGEQCTTTVKTALQEGGINIPDMTQKPVGILQDFKTLVLSTSIKHKGKKPIITVIKPESKGWTPTP